MNKETGLVRRGEVNRHGERNSKDGCRSNQNTLYTCNKLPENKLNGCLFYSKRK